MKINKDKNGYTFAFAIIMVLLVGVALSSLSIGLGPLKQKNVEVKKKMSILAAMGIQSTRENGEELYDKYILDSYVINAQGDVMNDLPVEKQAFNLDVQQQARNKKIKVEDRLYPIFDAKTEEGKMIYILPVVGKGLWGPIWGYVAIASDKETIVGASFDHKGETPGLGAEIAQSFFSNRFINEKISSNGSPLPIEVVKDGTGIEAQRVDGITGGTVTSKGVEKMINSTMAVYVKYFNKNK